MTQPAATRVAEELLAGLIARGVRDIVVCPGSRSQALALTAAAAERLDEVRVTVRLDERQAGFVALGLTHETGAPTAVIVTSGTAVGNLLPAVMEAHASRMPLIVLTADRPEELHGIRANQTVHQVGIFDRFVSDSFSIDADADADADAEADVDAATSVVSEVARKAALTTTGPVQINVAFRDPLSGGPSKFVERLRAAREIATREAAASEAAAPEATETCANEDAGKEHVRAQTSGESFVLNDSKRTVVIAGAGAGKNAEDFAHRARVPLFAEVVSGARFGREAITAYETLIQEYGDEIERAIVFGHPTLTRAVTALLQRDDLEVIVVDDETNAEHYNPGHNATIVQRIDIGDAYRARDLHSWLGGWIVHDRKLRAERSTVHEPDLAAATATGYKEMNAYARSEVAVKRAAVTRELLTDTVWRSSWPHDRLVVAASRLVRVLDRIAQPRPVKVIANRGLAGIDGTLATAIGVAIAQQDSREATEAAGVTRVITGDLAFLHDVNALELSGYSPRIQIIVGNDRGGTIFENLEVAQTADAEDFSRVMLTPHHVNIQAIAEAFGWEYHVAENRGDYEQLFTVPVSGPTIIEVSLHDEHEHETPGTQPD